MDDHILIISICMRESISTKRVNHWVAILTTCTFIENITCARALLNLCNNLRKRDKMQGLSLFHNEFNKFNNTGVGMSNSIYHSTLKSHFWCENSKILPYICNVVYDKITKLQLLGF